MPKTYVGITGFTKQEEILSALEWVKPSSTLMVGLVTTYKSIRALPIKSSRAKTIPQIHELNTLCMDSSRLFNVAHYSTQTGSEEEILEDLKCITRAGGRHLHGIQLNIAWPDVEVLQTFKKLHPEISLILQLGREAMEAVHQDLHLLAQRLEEYDMIEYILLDGSSGQAKRFEVIPSTLILHMIKVHFPHLGLGIAGGISPETMSDVRKMRVNFPNISIDAQGALRDHEHILDLQKVKNYLCAAQE